MDENTAPENELPENDPAIPAAPADEKQANTESATPSRPGKLDMSSLDIANQQEPVGALPAQPEVPPDNVSGQDAVKKRGRPRKFVDPDAQAAAKRASDAAYRARKSAEKAGIKTDKPESAAPGLMPETAPAFSPDAVAGAGIIMQSLDITCAVIGGKEWPGVLSPEEMNARGQLREQTTLAWAEYLQQNNAKLPPWALVVILSGTYVAPSFRTPTAQEKLGFAWHRFTSWFKAKLGK